MHRMVTQKRHIVYFSDEEWETLRKLAKASEDTISGLLRESVAFTLRRNAPERQPFVAPVERPFTPAPKPTRRK